MLEMSSTVQTQLSFISLITELHNRFAPVHGRMQSERTAEKPAAIWFSVRANKRHLSYLSRILFPLSFIWLWIIPESGGGQTPGHRVCFGWSRGRVVLRGPVCFVWVVRSASLSSHSVWVWVSKVVCVQLSHCKHVCGRGLERSEAFSSPTDFKPRTMWWGHLRAPQRQHGLTAPPFVQLGESEG